MKKYILALLVLVTGSLVSCDTKEKAVLQSKVDSLSIQLAASRQVEKSMDEVGILLDSIDASRKSLKVDMIEGGSYSNYVVRLQQINAYVKQTEAKLIALEKSAQNNSKATASSVRRLKADLEKQSQEIVELQLQIAIVRDENMALWTKVNKKDSVLSIRDQVIKVNESDIVSLEKLVNDTQAENKLAVANLYFDQAKALELAANRTHFAARKKKETRREALELYKLAHSLGNLEAQARINDLQNKLS
jgi:DNA-directed RNA polymerase beta subunit